ncbi:MAG: sigma-54 dependent transcriptional regulator [Pseudomonadota bacterium]|jgi:two-component system C4-dicarboxylate transport response regulator DctD|uniref:Two-component system C4-dicarboxylate transport response regulator DctD n=1 Tax=Actibacterium naphthalenivorans TaxID=1614693 RepID=A0A840CB11_9RHOB|nr:MULTISPECIES: sigma-54 dependent transcriptional regulator [Actibacterium]ALG90631.1 chemotaxis protein CheY [Actibacterium sp. EMB200-NS6]MBB4023191.1 two-component system C4-dicarboxylate transport response regulator DctD [Actibacterium naphthalenivorans]MDY6859948.1 sigma-54 dependent transcriptional regulator [Pseudomonadota bacterium]
MSRKVLLVDDDPPVREALGQTLELAGLSPVLAGSYIEAKDHVTPGFEGVVVTDIRMPGKDGFALLEFSQRIDPDLPVILLTGEGDIPMAVRGISAGAFDFLEKPCAPREFVAIVEKALKTRTLVLENRRLKRQVESGDAAARMLFGESRQADELRARVRSAARSSAEVLITGAPGTGTSKVAEVIHLLSAGSLRPFQKLAAASASPESLAGAFAAAEGGSLFLDELAALGPAAQFTLLELLDGDGGPRVIAGTYRDLDAEVAEGRFNPDLFYKLDVMRVRIPALRERPDDIPVLFRHYVSIACEQAALPQPEITTDVIARLMAQDWPGNARSLMNAAMRFAMGLNEVEQVEEQAGLAEQLARVEKSLLIEALRRADGHATEAAKALKLPRKTFYDKLARHGIRPEAYR